MVNSFATATKDGILTKKQDVTLNYLKYLSNKFFQSGELGWQQNCELEIANRLLVNATGGKAVFCFLHSGYN